MEGWKSTFYRGDDIDEGKLRCTWETGIHWVIRRYVVKNGSRDAVTNSYPPPPQKVPMARSDWST